MLIFQKFGQHRPLNRQAERYGSNRSIGAVLRLVTLVIMDGELRGSQPDGPLGHRRPRKAATFQDFLVETKAPTVPIQKLEPVAPAPAIGDDFILRHKHVFSDIPKPSWLCLSVRTKGGPVQGCLTP
jgi:hypothetical protein